MKHQPIAVPRIHANYCDCWDCNPHRVLDARRILLAAMAALAPLVILPLAVWSVLPR